MISKKRKTQMTQILQSLKDKNNLDFDDDFYKIKAVLEYCDDKMPLSKIQFRGGNEEIIEEVVECIERNFKAKGYMNDCDELDIKNYECELRKITFFLVLNTDATFKYDLNKDNSTCHVLNAMPQLPKFLLINLIWDLKLSKFFYEILKFTPCWFALQFYDQAIAFIKYLEPYEMLESVEGLLTSIFMNMCRADLRFLDHVDRYIIFNKLYDYAADILRQFYTPDIEKFSEWSKTKFYKYQGYSIKYLSDIILYCFDCFEYPVEKKIEDKYKIYDICLEMCPYTTDSNNKSHSPFVEENLLKIIAALLNSLQYNVMLITVSTFMYWVEIEFPNDSNLQREIGERAYKIIERISMNEKFEHDVVNQLKELAIRPRSCIEIIQQATIGSILRKLDDTATEKIIRQVWFSELINRPLALGNEECLNSILEHSELLTVCDFVKLMEFLKSELERVQDDELMEENDFESSLAIIAQVLTKSLKNFTINEVVTLMLNRIQLFGRSQEKQKNLDLIFTEQSLKDRCIEFFNKCTENFDIFKFLSFCFENPEYVWRKFFMEACISEYQVKNFVKTCESTKKLSSLFTQQLLDESILTKCEEKFFVKLIFELYQSNTIERNYFLKEFAYKNITGMLEQNQYIPLLCIFKILLKIANKSEISLNAPVLVMAGHVMDKLRWDLLTYSDLKDEIIRICIDFITSVSKKFLPVASEKDKNWLNKKIKLYRPITQYYFQKYSLKVDELPQKFDQFLHPHSFTDRNDIDEFLTSTYIRCTTKETEWLARNNELLPHISDVILILNGIVAELECENAIANYRYCILNYVNIINKFLIPKCSNDKSYANELSFKILKIIDSAPKGIYDEVFMTLYGMILKIFNDTTLTEEIANDIKKFIENMKNCVGKELFIQQFSTLIVQSSV